VLLVQEGVFETLSHHTNVEGNEASGVLLYAGRSWECRTT
jgi:hypothetical protein